MTNYEWLWEHNKKKLVKGLADRGIGIDAKTNKIIFCGVIENCQNCIAFHDNRPCKDVIYEWLNKEHKKGKKK